MYNTKQRALETKNIVLQPFYEAELVRDNAIVTSNLQQIITSAIHTTPIQQYIVKSAKWHPSTLHKIDWEAHRRAICRFSRTQRISITKLSHGLYHTNWKDSQYYGAFNLCPCCNAHPETLDHVFTCQSKETVERRTGLRNELKLRLERLHTHPKITRAIIHGLTEWESYIASPTQTITAPYRGTVLAADCILVQAFLEQSNEIGWQHFLRGRISTKWSQAYQSYCSKPNQEPPNAQPWAAQVVTIIWQYSSSLWSYRNGVKHGQTTAETIAKDLAKIQQQV
jgi:hypothetical protein